MSNAELLRRYFLICETNKGLTVKTIKGYGYDLNVFLRFIGDKAFADVTSQDCENFFAYCYSEKKNGTQAINRKFTSIKGLFKGLIKKDYLDMKNPMDKLDAPKIRRKLRPYLTYEDIEKVFQYLEEKEDLRTLAMISLFFYSGIRLSELYQLNRDSLDFIIEKFPVLGKGAVERYCIFSPYAGEKIQLYLKSRKDEHKALFYSRQKNRLCHRQIQIIIQQTVKKSTGKHMTPHNLRHSAAMFLLKRGVSLDKIQVFLGHKNINTTQIYAHNDIDDIKKAVSQVW